MQTNDYYQIEIITWSHIIISIRQEYLKPYNCVQIICIRWKYLISYNYIQKTFKKQLHKKCKYEWTMNVIP